MSLPKGKSKEQYLFSISSSSNSRGALQNAPSLFVFCLVETKELHLFHLKQNRYGI